MPTMILEYDQFNSSIFEFPMANVILEKKDYAVEEVKNVLERAEQEGYHFLSVKTDTNEKQTTNSFLKEGFDLVDTQIMYQIPLDVISVQRDERFVRTFLKHDKNEIMRIARTAFKLDQFHGNPALSQEKSDLYYEQWAKNLCEGLADDVFTIEKDGHVVGFLSATYQKNEATVGLAAIDSRYQNKGLFVLLLSGVIYYLHERGYRSLNYGTQLVNIPVLKTMARFLGIPMFSKYVLHKLLNDNIDGR